jgi:hypothetical protein
MRCVLNRAVASGRPPLRRVSARAAVVTAGARDRTRILIGIGGWRGRAAAAGPAVEEESTPRWKFGRVAAI